MPNLPPLFAPSAITISSIQEIPEILGQEGNKSFRNTMFQPSWQSLPSDLPKPTDDGACDHIKGSKFPSVSLPSTAGNTVDPSTLSGVTIIFCYPRTGAPNETVPTEWNDIPGARGCTPQACGFRDAANEFLELGVSHIFGCSTQDTPYQQELKQRIHLPYQLLSDENLGLVEALKLPTFEFQGKKLTKRLTLAVEDGKIVNVWYPVFPPNESAKHVIEWLKGRTGRENLSTADENAMMRNMQHKG
ncbi:hypothetical protein LTR37_020420 [Vermiconidia calcicola]|uniref:Uncharacterized protein n=1 Tax=Vermiconidia calcicola TaxID=1690605 RepID=A0ACC3MBE4_9PEZI|nr:hypothetical protein LTR37_020420 [Vermiconidia calcicola]